MIQPLVLLVFVRATAAKFCFVIVVLVRRRWSVLYLGRDEWVKPRGREGSSSSCWRIVCAIVPVPPVDVGLAELQGLVSRDGGACYAASRRSRRSRSHRDREG